MRIRTVKPEFWTDEKVGELTLTSRLLFIALLNYADDEGNFKCSMKQIKIYSFPYDDIDIQPYLNELVQHKFMIPYVVENTSYIHIVNFKKHQKINRPSPPMHPIFNEYSMSNHVLFTNSSQRKEGRKEGKGKEEERNKNKEEYINFDIVKDLFIKHDCQGAEEFYEKMITNGWKNKDGNLINNPINYILTTIERTKNELHKNAGFINKSNNITKQSSGKLTGAELRRKQRNEKIQ
jgi:hypothetical protein